jgi:hypothetical protein
MRRSLARLAAVPVACAGLAAAAVAAAPAAYASTDTGGSATVTTTFSYIAQLASAGVGIVPLSPASTSADTSNQTVTVTFPVTGGDGNLASFFGSVDLGGSLDVGNANNGDVVTLEDLQFDLRTFTIDGTPAGSTTPVALFDPAGTIDVSPQAASQSVTASELEINAAGAAYLDNALDTTAFTAGQDVGSFDASWTVSSS